MDQTIKRLTIFSILLVAYFLSALFIQISPLSGWSAHTTITHSLVQSIATVIALFCGIAALYRFNVGGKTSSMLLFIGVGFLGTAFIDTYHTIVTASWVKVAFPKIPPSVAEWSWLSTRIFLSMLLLMSLPSLFREKTATINPKLIYISVSILTFLNLIVFLFIRTEYPIYPDDFFCRPLELIPGVFFLIALIGYLIQGMWKTSKLEYWIVMFLITSIASQFFFIDFSKHPHDTMYISAHILKIISYAMIYIAVSD